METSLLSSFPSVGILGSGDRLLWGLNESRESDSSHMFGLMYRNGNSSSLGHGYVFIETASVLSALPFLEKSMCFLFSCLASSFPDAPSHFTGSFQSSQQHPNLVPKPWRCCPFPTARSSGRLWGMDIEIKQSGKWQGQAKLSKRGRGLLRRMLYMAAMRCIWLPGSAFGAYASLVCSPEA